MTKEKCEEIITEYFKKIRNVYKKYNPDGDYLSGFFMDDDKGGCIIFHNDEEPESGKYIFCSYHY